MKLRKNGDNIQLNYLGMNGNNIRLQEVNQVKSLRSPVISDCLNTGTVNL